MLCSKRTWFLRIASLSSTKHDIQRRPIKIGTELWALWLQGWMIILTTVRGFSRKMKMMKMMLHLMKLQVLGMWLTCTNVLMLPRRKQPPRSSPQNRIVDTTWEFKGLLLWLRYWKRNSRKCSEKLIHRHPQHIKQKVSLWIQLQRKIRPWESHFKTLHQTVQTRVFPQTTRWVFLLWITILLKTWKKPVWTSLYMRLPNSWVSKIFFCAH